MNIQSSRIAGSQFRIVADIPPDQAAWGHSWWISHAASTGAKQLVAIDGTFLPGQGHSFHKHPNQEEVLCVVEGQIEQWIEGEKRILGPGDAAFISPGTVHASFNAGKDDARLIAIFGPCVGDGIETVDVWGDAPWQGLRA